jgi:hypothetical protein
MIGTDVLEQADRIGLAADAAENSTLAHIGPFMTMRRPYPPNMLNAYSRGFVCLGATGK